jgi:hypothetical protein
MSIVRFAVVLLLGLSACEGDCSLNLYERSEACDLLPEADYLGVPLGTCDADGMAFADCVNSCYDDGGCDALDPDSELHDAAKAEVDTCLAACEDERG